MSNNQNSLLCALGGWGLAIIAGILAAVLLMVMGDWRLIQAIFAAIVIIVILGALMTWIVCRPLPAQGELPYRNPNVNPVPSNAEAAQAAASAAREGATAPAVAEEVSAPPEKVAAVAAASAARAGVVPSKALAGEAELAERKGSWRYEPDAAAAPAAAPKAPAKSEPEPKAAAAPAATAPAGEDYDKDGKIEGKEEGKRPEALSAAREGGADNLKEIKGIGPKLEILCNKLGFYHFDQIANWSEDEVAWVNANLEGFKGRVSRDNWVEQAKILASGGETEFSKRVDDGDVY